MFFSCNSYAKCNLFLTVKGLEPNGYHNIETLMAYLDICDRISIVAKRYGAGLNIDITGKFAHKLTNQSNWARNNIITKTFKVISQKYGVPVDFDVKLEKNIPIASGLGGGSSNAACIINFCNSFFGLEMTNEDKIDIAKIIGADVAFFTQDSAAICSGIGEIIQPINTSEIISDYSVLVLDPIAKISTQNVYSAYDNLNLSHEERDLYNLINNHISINVQTMSKLNKEVDIIAMSSCGMNAITDFSPQIMQSTKHIIDNIINDSESVVFAAITGAGSAAIIVFLDPAESAYQLTKATLKYPGIYAKQTKILPKVSQTFQQIGRYVAAA